MYTIVIPVPENLQTAINPYRQKYDPKANSIAANITLLKPFNFTKADEVLCEHLEEIGDHHSPIKVSLAGWDVYTHKLSWVCMPPIAGHQELIDLRENLLTGPLQPLVGQDGDYRPHIIIGRFANQTTLAQARQELKHFEPQFVFRAGKMALLHRETNDEVWQVKAEFGLNATAMSVANRR